MRPFLSRPALLVSTAAVAAILACGGAADGPTGPGGGGTPPTPVLLTITGPATASGTVAGGIGSCTWPLSAAVSGGAAGATAQWDGATVTRTAIVTGATTTEELTAAQLGTLYGAASVTTGQSATMQRTVTGDRAFRVRHDLRYRADGTVKSATHELRCDFAPVASVALAPATTTTLRPDETQQLVATPRDSAGTALTGRVTTWSSSAATVAQVSATGLVRGVSPGTATITATSEEKTATVTVTVIAAVSSITISPLPVQVSIGNSVTATATLKDAAGNVLTGRTVTWATSSTAMATVTGAGVVTGVAIGNGAITATSEGKTVSAPLLVVQPVSTVELTPATGSVPVRGTLALTAVTKLAGGTVVGDRPVRFASADTLLAKVDSVTGVVTGVSTGTVAIRATSEGKLATSQVTVLPPVAAVAITPAAASVAKGSTVALSATTSDSAGVALTGRPVTWSTSAPATATVSSTGVVTGVAIGTATITATSEGRTATARVDVTAPVATITLAPTPAAVAVGRTLALTATLKDANGAVLTGRRVTWTSSAPTYATVDTLGVVRGLFVGPVDITATVDARSATLRVSVVTAIATVSVAPSPAAVQVGDIVRLAATVADASGNPLSGRPVTWSSSTPAIATVNDTGLVTGVAIGAATIVAEREGVSANVTVNVGARQPVAAVALSPATTQVPIGAPLALTATLTDASGAVLNGRAVTWTSSAPAAATVSADGVVFGVATGSTTITATSEGKKATRVITVVIPVATLTLTPATAQFLPGATVTLVPRMTDASGAVITGRTITWVSSEPLVAAVSSAGVVTGVAPGSVRILATVESVSAEAQVTVLAPVATVTLSPATTRIGTGSSTTLAARLADASGNVLGARPITWTSSNTAVATVSAAGVVSGVAIGSVTITATSEGKSGTAAVTVSRPVATVTVSPATAAMKVGETLNLLATLRDATGATLAGGTVLWSSGNISVATVSVDGIVTAKGDGTATISASAEGKTGTMTVTATRAVAAVVMTPKTLRLRLAAGEIPSDSVLVLAAPVDANGDELTGRAVTWTSSAPAIVSVTSTGLAVPHALGTATITATSEGQAGTTEVTTYNRILYVDITDPGVVVVGQEVALTATPYTVYGPATDAPATQWVSSSPSVATISADGRLRALSLGYTTIEARVGDAYGGVRVTVGAGPAASITLSPSSLSIVPSGSASLLAVLRDAGGTLTTGTVTWTSSAPAIASVSAAGIVTAGATNGTATITAVSGAARATAAVTVAPGGPPVRIELVPGPTYTMAVRQQTGFGINAWDATGARVTATPTWTSSAPAVATVTDGNVTAVSTGTATITATVGGLSASTVVTTAPAGTVGSFYITASDGSLLVGQQKQLFISLKDVGGNAISPLPTVTWTSSAPAIATVTANGLLTAVGSGAVTITAAIPGYTATVHFTMGRPAVFAVNVSPAFPTGVVGETYQLTATVTDNQPTVLTDRVVAWQSSDPAVATVSATGLVTMRALGSTLITAASEGASGTVSLVVVSALAPVAKVVVTPARTMIPGWQTQPTPLTAVAYNASGGVISGRPITWRSTNPAVATVSASGGAIPVSPGDVEVVATMDGVSGSSWLSIDQKVIDGFQVIGPASLTLGESVPFDVSLWDVGSNPLPKTGRTFNWSSSNPSVLSVSSTGVATALAVGGAEVRLSTDGLAGSVYVRVLERSDSVARVHIMDAGQTRVVVGDSMPAFASYMTMNGQYGEYGISWTSSNPGVATVTTGLWNGSSAGVVQGLAQGTTLLTASIGGKSDTMTVTVINPTPVASITVSPNPLSLGVNESAQLYVTVKDASGNVLNGRPVTFTVASSSVATVTTGGFVVGRTVGTTTITVTSESKSVTVPVTVLSAPAAIASITVTPTPVSISKGSTIQLVATARDSKGAVLSGRSFSWSSGNSGVASVGGGGLVTGVTAGTANISASSGGVSGTGAVTVTLGTGGTGGTTVCSSNIQVNTPALGTNTGWISTKFSGIDFMITAFTGNSGTSTSPSYQYQVIFRNRYTQGIWFSARGPSVDQPTDTQYAKSLGAGATGASNSNYYNKPATLWVYIANVRLGSSTASGYCE